MKLSDSTEQGKESRVLATSVLRALRFLQVVRMIRVDRRLVSIYYILNKQTNLIQGKFLETIGKRNKYAYKRIADSNLSWLADTYLPELSDLSNRTSR